MKYIFTLSQRTVRLFLRDKTSVFMSLLTVIIIFVLYILFLADITVDSVEDQIGPTAGIQAIIQSWLLSGIIVVISLTVTLSVMALLVEDIQGNQLNALTITPMSRFQLLSGYLSAAWIVGVVFSVITLLLGQGYFFFTDKPTLSPLQVLYAIFSIAVIVASSSALLFMFLVLVSSRKAFSSLGTIIGTLSGFLLGIYIPIGQLPSFVQTITKFFPPTYGIAMLREICMMPALDEAFIHAPTEALTDFKRDFGLEITLFESVIPIWVSIMILLLSAAIFLSIGVLLRLRKQTV